MLKHLLCIATILLCSSAVAATNDSGLKVQWSYKGNTGPQRWGQLDPSFVICDSGKEQSPINIPKKTNLLTPDQLEIDYKPARFYILDDGATELMIGNTQTTFNDGQTVQVNFSTTSSSETIQYKDTEYQLVQLHFHSPSENLLQGSAHPLEIHFVHQGKNGKVAVLGVFVQAGEPNEELRKIIENLPPDSGVIHEIQDKKIDPAGLLPANEDYYSFMGSLTTPPCTEGLQWIVLKNPITASPAQILRLRNVIGSNARPVQFLNKRPIIFAGT